MHPNLTVRTSPHVRIALIAAVPTATALAPLLLTGHQHVYGTDPVNHAAAFVPLLGLLGPASYLVLTCRRPSWAGLALVPYCLLAVGNVFVWTRLVSFDPCYHSHDACNDIGGGPLKVLCLFLVTIVMPAAALIGGLVHLARDDG